jgi:murein DD-endopeptidase MepM/ murein hydrolase activator NlpD
MKGHTGLDLYAPRRTKLYASQSGTVVEISTEPERGLGVDVVTDGRWQMDEHGEHYASLVADLLRTLGETIVAAYLSHAIYNTAFRKPIVG